MEDRQQLLSILNDYKKHFAGEVESLKEFEQFLSYYQGDFLYTRNNFIGHITTSAFIINEEKNEVLLLKHKFLKRWLQPGGHVDETDRSLMDSALREVQEETGISSTYLLPVKVTPSYLFDIDSHPIPENTLKNEPAHIHHDFRFLFIYNKMQPLQFNSSESLDTAWVSFDNITLDLTFKRVIQKILSIIF